MATFNDLTTLTAQIMKDVGFNANSQSDYGLAVNEAQKELTDMLKCFYKTVVFSSVNGLFTYALPADFMAIYANDALLFVNAAGTPLQPPYTTYDNVRDLQAVTGDPVNFWHDEQYLYLYPTPTYSGANNMYLNYYYYPADMVNTTDICQFSNKFKYGLCYLAAAVMAQNNELYDDAMRYRNMAMTRLREITNNETPGLTNKKINAIGFIG